MALLLAFIGGRWSSGQYNPSYFVPCDMKEKTTTTTTMATTTPATLPPVSGQQNVQEIVTQCQPKNADHEAALQKEMVDYEKSARFDAKIKEVQGKVGAAVHHVSIEAFLREKVLRPNWSVLELGCAAGVMLQMVQRAYVGGIGAHKQLVGVELVPGWVKFAQEYFKDISIFQGMRQQNTGGGGS
jgi:hypothetical protein